MTTGATFPIRVLGIAHRDNVKNLGEGIRCPRDGDEMDMIRHKTIGKKLKLVLRGIISDESEIVIIIGVFQEYNLPIVASLGHVVGIIRHNNACDPWHESSVAKNE